MSRFRYDDCVRALILFALLACAACSQTEPSVTARVIDAVPPRIVCSGDTCYVSGILYNTGPSCATAISGSSNGLTWTGPIRLEPGQSAPYTACCRSGLSVGITSAVITNQAERC